ncbi:uncharacterized protein F4817DRAFT_350975 [Daldinia loculata]|uniref:uncharacterized protein n=1 Tax=Daldinia loculata TaxID=103429 RepID=UPI0020C3D263|nr:uncharacterized protein F4817DRAFT_350975 [Daldinia loculata]KAI1643114.1 hypothetical protein F4817DRAFT_350975 [Daldinia loculata]
MATARTSLSANGPRTIDGCDGGVSRPPHTSRLRSKTGVVGPSSIYLSLSKLVALGSGIPALRLDYRYSASLMAMYAQRRLCC